MAVSLVENSKKGIRYMIKVKLEACEYAELRRLLWQPSW